MKLGRYQLLHLQRSPDCIMVGSPAKLHDCDVIDAHQRTALVMALLDSSGARITGFE